LDNTAYVVDEKEVIARGSPSRCPLFLRHHLDVIRMKVRQVHWSDRDGMAVWRRRRETHSHKLFDFVRSADSVPLGDACPLRKTNKGVNEARP
jgi:hypothetical protein